MRVLVTGASGFIGQALCQALSRSGHTVRRVIRARATNDRAPDSRFANPSVDGMAAETMETVGIDVIGPETNWSQALAGIESIVHLAARVHVLKETAADPLTEFRQVNVAGSERLARMAVAAGVRRLVYVSSVKVNGESTSSGRAFSEEDAPSPQDAYGLSKWEAEQALLEVARETGLEVVIVRPPLVYGPGVGGNFLRLMNWIDRGWPLPLGSVSNARSLIYLGNLVDVLTICVESPRAAGKIFLASDGEDVSTPELIRRLARVMGRQPRLISIPPAILRIAGLLTGKSAETERLLGSLCVDSSRIRRELQWTPPFPLEQGLRETAAWYLKAFHH